MSTTTSTEQKIQFVGKSGTSYEFYVYRLNPPFNKVGGVYAFTKVGPNGNHTVLYVGQTGDLSSRFFDHHKQECVNRRGVTHICARVVGTEKDRLAIEKDLVDYYNPPCNG